MSVTAVPIRPIAKGSLVKLWLGIALALAVASATACGGTRDQVRAGYSNADFLASNGKRKRVVTTASGLQYQVVKPGAGPRPGPGDITLVEYEGRLRDGTVFDSTAKQGQPAQLPVSGLVPGMTEGLQLMQKGSTYRFWIPPELGYGAQGAGGVIPPDAVLEFDFTMLEFAPMPAMGGPGAPPPGM